MKTTERLAVAGLAALGVVICARCVAQTAPPHYSVVVPGSLRGGYTLSRFNPELAELEAALQHGDKKAARRLAEERVGAAPSDFGAYVGLLQAAYGELEPLYTSAVKQSKTGQPNALARLGAAEFYLWDQNYYVSDGSKRAQGDSLIKKAVQTLALAWKLGRDSEVGILYLEAAPFARQGPFVEVCEGILEHELGQEAFRAYLASKRRRWADPLPTVTLSKSRLASVEYALRTLRWVFAHPITKTKVTKEDGITHVTPVRQSLSREKQRIDALLTDWETRIRRNVRET